MSSRRHKRPPNSTDPHQARESVTAEIQEVRFSGFLPPPAILESYDRIIPGAAERILVMAEADAQYEREITSAAFHAEEAFLRRGQNYGLTIGIVGLMSAVVCVYLGAPTVAGVIGGTTVIGLVSAFIIGRFTKPSEISGPPLSS